MRLNHLPRFPGADWRDLPNKDVILKNGTKVGFYNLNSDKCIKQRLLKGRLIVFCWEFINYIPSQL